LKLVAVIRYAKMALSTRQVVLLLSCVSLVLADYQGAYESKRVRTGRQQREDGPPSRPQRRLRPLQKRPAGPKPVPEEQQVGAGSERFSSFGQNEGYNNNNFGNQPQSRPNFRPDGTEYDEYGNRQQYQNAGKNIPRGYDRRGYEEQQPIQQQQPSRPRPVYPNPSPKRTIDTKRKAVIDEVDPALLAEYEAMAQQYDQPQQAAQPRADSYVPASGPAYASPSMLNPVYANARSDLGPGQLEASVLAGAEAYGVAARPEGVYQNEERLSFQIHGQEGPNSYRYGYDTGNGFNRQFRYEERSNEGYVKGRYGFYDEYGKLKVVNYEADPIHGFHAEGDGVPKYPH